MGENIPLGISARRYTYVYPCPCNGSWNAQNYVWDFIPHWRNSFLIESFLFVLLFFPLDELVNLLKICCKRKCMTKCGRMKTKEINFDQPCTPWLFVADTINLEDPRKGKRHHIKRMYVRTNEKIPWKHFNNFNWHSLWAAERSVYYNCLPKYKA